jgi:hypothetical protein
VWDQIEPNIWREPETRRLYGANSLEEAQRAHNQWLAQRRQTEQLFALRAMDADQPPQAARPRPGLVAELDGWTTYQPVYETAKRRLPFPAFKLELNTVDDAGLRLSNTIVYIGPDPVFVTGVALGRDGQMYLLFRAVDGKDYKIAYHDPKVDLRSPEPQYLVYHHEPVYLIRNALRQQKQGLDRSNSMIKPVNKNPHRWDHAMEVCKGLKEQTNLSWTPQYHDLMVRARAFRSLRLSPNVCFFADDDKVKAEYRGRLLGDVNDNEITLDDSDKRRPWIAKAVKEIGCEVK